MCTTCGQSISRKWNAQRHVTKCHNGQGSFDYYSNYLVGVHRGIYRQRWPPADINTHKNIAADDVYNRPFNPTPPRSPFGVRNEFAQYMNSGTSQYLKDRHTEKDEFPLVDRNRVARKVVDKIEEIFASNAVANLRNSGQFRQSYFPSPYPSQAYSSPAPGIGYNNVLERPDIFGFRAEVCEDCLSLKCTNVLYPTAEGGGYTLGHSHRCDPKSIALAKNIHDKSRFMEELSKGVPGLLKKKIFESIIFLGHLVARKITNPPPEIIKLPNPNDPQKPLSLVKALQIRTRLSLNNYDHNHWAWKAINIGTISLTDKEVAEFLQIVNGATFAVVEVHRGSQGQKLAPSFYIMYLANSLDFESILRNQINSTTKDSLETIAGIDGGLNIKGIHTGVHRQDTGSHLEESFYEKITGLAYEGRVCENCLDSYTSVYYYRKDKLVQVKEEDETEHQCDPQRLIVGLSVPNKDEMIASHKEKLPKAICNRIETQNQLLAFKLSVRPPDPIEILPPSPNHYIARVIRAGQTTLNKQEKLDFLERTGSSTCAYFKVHLVKRKKGRKYSTLPYLFAIQVDKTH